MITISQITAQNTDPLTNEQVLVLFQIVKQYQLYRDAPGRYPSVKTKLEEEQNSPTVKTKALKAVITAHNELPSLVVQSQGSDKQPGYFETKNNWDALAIDILDILFDYSNTAWSSYLAVPKTKYCTHGGIGKCACLVRDI